MKRMLALLVALMATTIGGFALDANTPEWLEEMGPGAEVTHGEYSTLRAVVEDGFTSQTLNSKLSFSTGDVKADIDQTVKTAIKGTPTGVTRQLLEQSAEASVLQVPSLAIDAEKPAEKTTLVMGMEKDQSALFSGMIVAKTEPVLKTGVDAPFDGTGSKDLDDPNRQDSVGFDDQYGGQHANSWYDFKTTPVSFTATFDDTGSLTTTDANDEQVTLKQKLEGAKVVVSAIPAAAPPQDGGLMQLSSGCTGKGEIWYIAPTGLQTLYEDNPNVLGQVPVLPVPTFSSSAQLTEAAAAVSSNVVLEDKEVEILGTVYDIRTMDGSFGLEGAFANAVLTEDSIINVDLDGDMDFWWT